MIEMIEDVAEETTEIEEVMVGVEMTEEEATVVETQEEAEAEEEEIEVIELIVYLLRIIQEYSLEE